ncbi:TetR/AcrR family transcriptional regulator [Alicyclobacillus fodiniaquatilis]|jgi:AcrR family transcriptional regulator|uniref:TetR/AcrR family transcriptional regulator n=1 Tax=Alicyclobacillus fodiniaquatilis TaxID=1661150 RepID=A0ABW4JFQ8_9BACL
MKVNEPPDARQNQKLTRSERKDAAASRCRILEVARQLFGECGVESVSMHQIAKSAHVGQGTLYRRYAHKGELCMDILKESAQSFIQQTESYLIESQDKVPDLERLDHVIVGIIDFTDAKAHLLSVIDHKEFVGDNIFYQRLHEFVCRLLEPLIAASEQPCLDAVLVADVLLSAVSPRLYMFERETRGYSKAQIIAGIRRLYMAGLNPENDSI